MKTNIVLLSQVPDRGLVLILGGIGSGKSTLAYAIAEDKHMQTERPVFVFGFPEDKANLLPNYITPISGVEFPENSIILIDEAYIQFHSRTASSQMNRFIDMFTGLVRQKDILAIYVTQTARKLDVGVVSSTQLLLVKKPSVLQIRLDRSSMRDILNKALSAFNSTPANPLECVYMLGDNIELFLQGSNKTPSFWSEELSKAWKGVSLENALSAMKGKTSKKCIVCGKPIKSGAFCSPKCWSKWAKEQGVRG